MVVYKDLDEIISDFKSKKTFYLAHPTTARKEIREWELAIEEKYDITLLNPFFDNYRKDSTELKEGNIYTQNMDYKSIVEEDLNAIDRCDGILAVLTENSMGTAMEIFYNSVHLSKPTYMIIEDSKLLHHPWIKYLSSYPPFKSREEFTKEILENCIKE